MPTKRFQLPLTFLFLSSLVFVTSLSCGQRVSKDSPQDIYKMSDVAVHKGYLQGKSLYVIFVGENAGEYKLGALGLSKLPKTGELWVNEALAMAMNYSPKRYVKDRFEHDPRVGTSEISGIVEKNRFFSPHDFIAIVRSPNVNIVPKKPFISFSSKKSHVFFDRILIHTGNPSRDVEKVHELLKLQGIRNTAYREGINIVIPLSKLILQASPKGIARLDKDNEYREHDAIMSALAPMNASYTYSLGRIKTITH